MLIALSIFRKAKVNIKNSIHCYNDQLDKNEIRYIDIQIEEDDRRQKKKKKIEVTKLSQVASYKFREAFMCTVQNNKK